MKKLIWMLILVLSVFESESFAKPWNGILPCVSTRLDAEKILGKDTVPHTGPFGTYQYKKSQVSIVYSRRDEKTPANDIVQTIEVFVDPHKSIFLTKYIKNMPNFFERFSKKVMDPEKSHIGYLAFYSNKAEGFDITVQKNDEDLEVITGFRYSGLESDCTKLPPIAPKPAGNDF